MRHSIPDDAQIEMKTRLFSVPNTLVTGAHSPSPSPSPGASSPDDNPPTQSLSALQSLKPWSDVNK